MSIVIRIAKVRADEIMFIFIKFEGYILSGIGSRSVSVDRQAGWLAGWQTNP